MKANKWLLIGGVVVLAVGIWYFFLGGSGEEPEAALSTNAGGESSLSPSDRAGQELLVLLDELKRIRLDDAVFTDPVFRSLVDFREPLPAQPAGRENPFAPLGQ